MHDELVKRLKYKAGWDESGILEEAAEAIEELSHDLDIVNEANIALHGALPMWIPVTERLPEKAGKYLVCGRWSGKQVEMWVCELIAFGKIKGWANEARNPAVTNWMPLPEPPKEE